MKVIVLDDINHPIHHKKADVLRGNIGDGFKIPNEALVDYFPQDIAALISVYFSRSNYWRLNTPFLSCYRGVHFF